MRAESASLIRLVTIVKLRRTVFWAALAVVLLLVIGFWTSRTIIEQHNASPLRGPHGIYSTKFPLNEFPISEGGIWAGGHTAGVDWSDLGTFAGHSYGSVRRPGYDDPTALLTGVWGPDQMARGTVFSVNQQDSPNQEVELRLRSSLSAHRCTGYEIGWRVSPNRVAYMGIARWNGKLGDFTPLVTHYGTRYGVSNGDVIAATAIGGVISAYKNGVLQARVKDSTFRTGSPGMGTDWGTGTNIDFGLSQFVATDQITDAHTPN
jgi:hypothetical protein